ncbi:hydroxyethylthiazole kinase [Rhodoblastus acidophilus]|uniref:Hydroxyethylthiazole kinase n=1 Tax=Rhodoblastus acidophilus TaxID=1074 RepID=A0A6N8DI38_RHOAC|nr:hydroxyethylthiazole kinase [Rhodoblastus acidophilus]MCW2273047.1 hydroxyethylthiazole kinase [Rhodoblastus acidophilus]MTV29947.1 hydroxyethylthiazole kinase [Rhodoblastus acidophilus]
MSTSCALTDAACRLLDDLRQKRPLVQNVTNYVAMDLSANALLAIGASPAMVHAPEEAGEFAALSDAVVINIGTLSKTFVAGMMEAARVAGASSKPWVLDPVGAGATKYRNETIAELLALKPTVIRGNASEIIAVARVAGFFHEAAAGKGVDSLHGTEAALEPALALARGLGCVVAATGAVDLVTDGARVARIANGAPIMAQVTASGCALSGILGAFVALTPDFFAATVAALGIYGVAGEIAAAGCAGPGSFRVALLDQLAGVGGEALRARLKLSQSAVEI